MTDSNQLAAKVRALASNHSTVLVGVLALLTIVFSVLEPKFFSVATANNILTDWG